MMRRLAAAAALTVAVLGGAACSGDEPAPGAASGGAGATASPQAGPSGGSAAAGGAEGTATGNGRQVCADAQKLSSEKVAAFIGELAKMLTAAGEGDKAAAGRAERAAAAAIREWSAGLRAQADRADDPRLAEVLDEMAAETATMTADIDSIDEARLDELQRRLDQLCGG